MSTKFFTNRGENTLINKFDGIFKHTSVHTFDALVGYFRSSGYLKTKKNYDFSGLCLTKKTVNVTMTQGIYLKKYLMI